MYCALDDIKKYHSVASLIQLTDDSDAQTAINVEVVDGAIHDACELIDGYLRGRYTLPLAKTPKLIVKLAIDISLYHLYQRRFSGEMPQTINDGYKNSVKALEHIQKGLLHLDAESINGKEPGEYRCNKTKESRIFNGDLLSKF